jgi:hypothetical protein
MRNIISSFKEDCRPNAKLKIFCPDYTCEELQYLVDFLYEGAFYCDNPEECEKIFAILKNFGFPKDLKSSCQNSFDGKDLPEVQSTETSTEISPSDEAPETSGFSEHEEVTLEVTLDPNLFEHNTQNLDDLESQALDDQNTASSICEISSNVDQNNILEDRNHEGNLLYAIIKAFLQKENPYIFFIILGCNLFNEFYFYYVLY